MTTTDASGRAGSRATGGTLTEKFLLYAGAEAEAGAVKARAGRCKVTSDWMALEQERGISITSSVGGTPSWLEW